MFLLFLALLSWNNINEKTILQISLKFLIIFYKKAKKTIWIL